MVDENSDLSLLFLALFSMPGKGFLTIEDLKKAFSQVAPHLGHHRLESIFRYVPKPGQVKAIMITDYLWRPVF